MIVGSGAAHAIVNAVLKSGKDKMSSRALIDGFSALLMFPAAFFLPLPHDAWGWNAFAHIQRTLEHPQWATREAEPSKVR